MDGRELIHELWVDVGDDGESLPRAMGWGRYSSDQQWDLQPYPEEWFRSEQQA